MNKYLIAIMIGVAAGSACALSLEAVPSWFGPASLSPFLDSWKASIEGESTTQTAAAATNATAITTITPIFDTNTVVDATISTPLALGQLLVGATNLHVAVGLTTNDWLLVK